MFYLIDKPAGISSSQAMRKFMHENNIEKAGHSGTLDPFATGLLVIGTDEDTKFLSRFLDAKKTYTGVILFGRRTDTLDPEGEIVATADEFRVSERQLQRLVNEKFIGKIKQLPPKFSAKKIDGKKAYELARKDQEVILKPASKIVFDFQIKATDDPNKYSFEVTVSSGTYIRALARDIGNELGIPSMLEELRRIKILDLSVEDASPVDSSIEDIKSFTASQIFNIKTLKVSDDIMKYILEGKRTNLSKYQDHLKDEYELILEDKNRIASLLVSNVGKHTYKIKKRLK